MGEFIKIGGDRLSRRQIVAYGAWYTGDSNETARDRWIEIMLFGQQGAIKVAQGSTEQEIDIILARLDAEFTPEDFVNA